MDGFPGPLEAVIDVAKLKDLMVYRWHPTRKGWRKVSFALCDPTVHDGEALLFRSEGVKQCPGARVAQGFVELRREGVAWKVCI